MEGVTLSDTLNINDLPIEILRHIASYFSQKELLLTVAPVCWLWHELAYDPVLWRSLAFDLSNELITSKVLENCFARVPLLESLEIIAGRRSQVKVSVEHMRCCAMHCKNIRELQLRFVIGLDLDLVSEVVHLFPNLQSLNLEGCEGVDLDCIHAICGLSRLRVLNLAHCTQLRDEVLNVVSSGMPRLESLNVDGLNHITDTSLLNFIPVQGHQLHELQLDGEELSDDSITAISDGCPLLSCLMVSFCGLLTDKSLIAIRKMSTLKKLAIRKGTQLTVDGLRGLFEHQSTLQNLIYLDLSECSLLNDVVLQAMCSCCGRMLRKLALTWCWEVTETGLCSIVDSCNNLRYLDLVGIDKPTGQCLEKVPELIPRLTFLNLQQCNRINDSLVDQMLCRKPDLVAINYYGETFSCGSNS